MLKEVFFVFIELYIYNSDSNHQHFLKPPRDFVGISLGNSPHHCKQNLPKKKKLVLLLMQLSQRKLRRFTGLVLTFLPATPTCGGQRALLKISLIMYIFKGGNKR
jgi:hypothetical protein